ncbi:MAG: aminotransferase class V-fold PLP-dependent enzyme [Candidatus Moraniibacteriota bacterium]
MLAPQTIKKDFPIFESQPDLVYLDSAATALKPKMVVDATNEYYFEYSANAARGLYPLAELATTALENARKKIARFINATSDREIVFTANATHGINLVALGLEESIPPEANIVVTDMEHHSNFLPWKELARRSGAELRSALFTEEGVVSESSLASLVDEKTVIVAFAAVSNVLGVQNRVTDLAAIIRDRNPNALILIDACQAVGHFPVDMEEWDADFIVFSGHKLFGPTGIGVLAGKKVSLEKLSEKNVGGGTVLDACSTMTRYKSLPENLEGGTPNIAGAIGLAAAIEYIETLGLENIRQHEIALMDFTLKRLREAFGEKIHILGTLDAEQRAGLVSFALHSIHPHDLAQILGENGVCVRGGELCASPLHRALKLPATTRVSLSLYNREEDIEKLIAGIQKALTLFG